MLHPYAELRNSKIEGKGLFASKLIPKGTIFWILKSQDRVRRYSLDEYRQFSSRYRNIIDRFSYPESDGTLVLSLENDKHWNHSCDANVLDVPTTDMCIVVRDIQQGEEITYDYAQNLRNDLVFRCHCGAKRCRKVVRRAKLGSAIFLNLQQKSLIAQSEMDKVVQPLLRHS